MQTPIISFFFLLIDYSFSSSLSEKKEEGEEGEKEKKSLYTDYFLLFLCSLT
jgi:hypothetical protein